MVYKSKIKVVDATPERPSLVVISLLSDKNKELRSIDILLETADKIAIEDAIFRLIKQEELFVKNLSLLSAKKKEIESAYPGVKEFTMTEIALLEPMPVEPTPVEPTPVEPTPVEPTLVEESLPVETNVPLPNLDDFI